MLIFSKFSFFGPGNDVYDLCFPKEDFCSNDGFICGPESVRHAPRASDGESLLLAQKKKVPGMQKMVIKLKGGAADKSLCINMPTGFVVSEKGYMFLINRNVFLITLFFFALNLMLGLVKKFKSRLYLVGLRVRVERIYRKALILKLNLCHKVK
jgi:hypothetical protein